MGTLVGKPSFIEAASQRAAIVIYIDPDVAEDLVEQLEMVVGTHLTEVGHDENVELVTELVKAINSYKD